MNVNFEHTDAATVEPIVFEQVFAEKPGGGIVKNPSKDLPTGTAVGQMSDGSFAVADGTTVKGEYLIGAKVYAGKGDQTVRLINGANVRKESVTITKEVLAQMPTIKLV